MSKIVCPECESSNVYAGADFRVRSDGKFEFMWLRNEGELECTDCDHTWYPEEDVELVLS